MIGVFRDLFPGIIEKRHANRHAFVAGGVRIEMQDNQAAAEAGASAGFAFTTLPLEAKDSMPRPCAFDS